MAMAMRTVDAYTLKRWMDNGEAVLVDVREPAEYAAERIEGAILIPLSAISKAALPEAQNRKLVIHCKKGGRGGSACEKLLAEDPQMELYGLEGGLSSWTEAGLPTFSSGRFFLPLDRQVQLTIGVSILLASILGYVFGPEFFLVTGFFGIGLTFAGLTGYCGLAHIMARFPWNQKAG